jgi:hypothetical protein
MVRFPLNGLSFHDSITKTSELQFLGPPAGFLFNKIEHFSKVVPIRTVFFPSKIALIGLSSTGLTLEKGDCSEISTEDHTSCLWDGPAPAD